MYKNLAVLSSSPQGTLLQAGRPGAKFRKPG
jgi:hypothetical protein